MKFRRTRCFIVIVMVAVGAHLIAERRFVQSGSASEVNNCSSCHRQATPEVFAAFSGSTHALAGVTCDGCHGGDASAMSKQKAHGAKFTARPDANETLALCSSCHTKQFEAFKTSRHFQERTGTPRLDCAFCHGSHSIGSPSSAMSFKLQCSSCHGLEYLPDLPAALQSIVSIADEQKASLATLLKAGRKPDEQSAKLRKETRRIISDIVHRTDLKSAGENLTEVKRLGDEFKRAIEK